MKIESKGSQDKPKFMVEDKVIIHSFRVEKTNGDKDELAFSLDYDDQQISETDAIELAESAVELIISNISSNLDEKYGKQPNE